MKLSEVLRNIAYLEIKGDDQREVTSVSQDTREISQLGTLYCAIRGITVDGHTLIPQAIEKGAAVIVCEKLPEIVHDDVTYVIVEHSLQVLGILASNFYGNPSDKMKVIGVTGTNGKTTIAHTIYSSLLEFEGEQPLLLSTAGDFFNGKEVDVQKKTASTIEPVELQKTFAHYLKKGATHVCLEVTSHGLDQYRTNGINFDIAIFTNLTQDHLDYHKTMEHYAKSKKRFFDMLTKDACAIINSDSEYGNYMVEDTQAQVISYGQDNADFVISNIQLGQTGQTFTINNHEIQSKQIGMFNAYNATAAFIALTQLGFQEEDIKSVFSTLDGAKGRLQIIPNETGICAVIDYAHTPDALENVLETLSQLPHGNLITIFGCGGDRDTTKRTLMAQIAQKYSDIVIATSDNPRTEDPVLILKDVEEGFDASQKNYHIVVNREEAIQKAVTLAQKDDIIVITGKGHEEYQIIGTETVPFSDQAVLEKYLD